MGLLDGLTGSNPETPMDVVQSAADEDKSLDERVALYREAIELSESLGETDVSTCTLAHFSYAEIILRLEYSDGIEDPIAVADHHLHHTIELIDDGHADEEMAQQLLPGALNLRAQVALERENWGLAIDRVRQAMASGLPSEYRPEALHVLGSAHEALGNEEVSRNYYAQQEAMRSE